MDNNSETNSSRTVVIVGAGVGGSLCASYFAKHGFRVQLFELRPDMRVQNLVVRQSINMTLSRRGFDALAYIDCAEKIQKKGIMMGGRMLHHENGQSHSAPYGTEPDHKTMSIGRRVLNELLIEEISKLPNVKINFQHRFISWNSDTKTAVMQDATGKQVHVNAEVIIGFDGSHSAVRAAMMKTTCMNYSQEYIDSHYIELRIPPKDDEFAMAMDHIHIWPRNQYLIVAQPNPDKTFTAVFFAPLSLFRTLKTAEQVICFFRQYFSDVLTLIETDTIVNTFFTSKPSPIIMTKCTEYLSSRGDMLLMGDAAHSMAPFYGQGMNAAFEDCLVLFEHLQKNNFDLSKAFLAYSRIRVVDTLAMVDLSAHHYHELSHRVFEYSYLCRKKIDRILYQLMPRYWVPLYTMVTFTRIPYRQCIERHKRQNFILRICRLMSYTILGFLGLKLLDYFGIKQRVARFTGYIALLEHATNPLVGYMDT